MKVLGIVPCEEVRREATGLLTLLGVSTGPVGFSFPAVVRAAAQLRFELEEGEPSPDLVTYSVHWNGAPVREVSSPLKPVVHPLSVRSWATDTTWVRADQPGVITFRFAFRAGDFEFPVIEHRFEVVGLEDGRADDPVATPPSLGMLN